MDSTKHDLKSKSFTLQGKVKDKDDDSSLAYVSIGILNKPIGIVSDSNGDFTLTIGAESLEDTLQISRVGYLSKKIVAHELIPSKAIIVIPLLKKVLLLDPVFVVKKGRFTEIAGRQSNGKFLQVSICAKNKKDLSLGSEVGMKIRPKHIPALLKDLNWFLSGNNFDKIKFRINVYSLMDNLPDSLIFNKDIYWDVTNSRTGWIKVDLESYLIRVNGDFVISLQWVDSKISVKEDPLALIPASISLFNTSYFRLASQDKWRKFGARLSYYVSMEY